jgi:hypothetical protein
VTVAGWRWKREKSSQRKKQKQKKKRKTGRVEIVGFLVVELKQRKKKKPKLTKRDEYRRRRYRRGDLSVSRVQCKPPPLHSTD